MNVVKCVVRVVLSQAVVVDRTMYISGQLGLDVASGQLVEGGVQAQAKQVTLIFIHTAAFYTKTDPKYL